MEYEFNSDEELHAILSTTGIDLKPHINSEYELVLDADRKIKDVQSFLKAVKPFRFRSLSKLSINMFEYLDKKSLQDALHFMKFSIPFKMNTFVFQSEDSDIKNYLKSLSILLPRVSHKVEISNFVLTQRDIKCVSDESYLV